jgi:hypothetical protein
MGFYINPANVTKSEFLNDHGDLVKPVGMAPPSYKYNNKIAVCLVDNVAFEAALICYCVEEFEMAKDCRDTRPKVWFMVPIECVKPFMDGHEII